VIEKPPGMMTNRERSWFDQLVRVDKMLELSRTENAALKDERDKLAKEAATSTAAFMQQCGDLDRLRAALETIAKYHDCEVDSACADIARRALED
jgi:hypothetical protein